MTIALQPVPTQQTPVLDANGNMNAAWYQFFSALLQNVKALMPMTTKLFDPVYLSTAPVTIYTLTTSPSSIVITDGIVKFSNDTASVVSVTAYAVAAGGHVSTTPAFLSTVTVSPNSFMDVRIPVLSAGGSLVASASTTTAASISQVAGSQTS